MNPKNLSELTDQELLQEAKKMKTTSLINAALIGFLAGVVVYSVVKSTWGFLTLRRMPRLTPKVYTTTKLN